MQSVPVQPRVHFEVEDPFQQPIEADGRRRPCCGKGCILCFAWLFLATLRFLFFDRLGFSLEKPARDGFPEPGEEWPLSALPELLNRLDQLPEAIRHQVSRVEVRNLSDGQSGAVVREFRCTSHDNLTVSLVFKSATSPGGDGTREAQFWKSSLYASYVEKSRELGGMPLQVYYVKIDPAGGGYTMLMEMGGLHFPGEDGDQCPLGLSVQKTQEQWLPVVANELAVWHSTFWNDPRLLPVSWVGAFGRFLFFLDTHTKTIDRLQTDPYPLKSVQFPFLTGFGLLSLFDTLMHAIFGLPVPSQKLWSILPMRSGLDVSLSADDGYDLIRRVGDLLASRPVFVPKSWTVSHNDLKYQNVLIKDLGTRYVAQMFDFDIAGVGPGPKDLAVLIVTSLDGAEQRALEKKTISLYCSALFKRVAGYTSVRDFHRECVAEYFESSLTTLFTMNFLAAKGEKFFPRLRERTLIWFLNNADKFDLTDEIKADISSFCSKNFC